VLDAAYFRTHTPEQVRTRMQHRRKEKRTGMPHFAGELSSDQVAQIVTYLRTLPPEL
jgi:mono/diheme cytochrome c family protein